ncbi:hypothetical protein BT96DRAFT_1009721 [Gymnopus androsaceus JB14]|uniref:JmjC domain-containing protein n=1 Tax=Gymnopus androsaceus JB14 TaxID=1447944 RepID=A0A6A4GC37_9AGAR|nr:hypothetical protein BT96DRAFT_1009721 [Gymnopus androsaceus JB14]
MYLCNPAVWHEDPESAFNVPLSPAKQAASAFVASQLECGQDASGLEPPFSPQLDAISVPSHESANPSAYKTRPYITSPPSPVQVDLLSDVLGSQVHHLAEIQTWPNGWKTVLPTLVETVEGKPVNLLRHDSDRVRWMADPHNAVDDNGSIVKYLDHNCYNEIGDMLEDIHCLMSKGHVVVLSGAVPHMRKRITSLKHIIHDFGGGFNPEQFLLNDGLSSWKQSRFHYPIKTQSHIENLLITSWGLIHHAGVYTNVHQDSEGCNTTIEVAGDRRNPVPKIWGILTFTDPSTPSKTRKDIFEMISRTCSLRSYTDDEDYKEPGGIWPLEDPQWSEICKVELVYALPGDIIFQPAGTLHLVFTPAMCVTHGGHFYSFDTMHLTEFTRALHVKAGEFVTNAIHEGIIETLVRMLLALPDMTTRVFYKRSIASLCLMVLYPKLYEAPGTKISNAIPYIKEARNIARIVIREYLGIVSTNTIQKDLKNFISQSEDYRDPGEPFKLGMLLHNLAGHDKQKSCADK